MLAARQTAGLRVEDLSPGETALLCAARAIALGHADCALMQGLLAHGAQDPDGALCHLLAFVRLIGWRGTRPIELRLPGSASVSDDEVLMLGALAAAEEAAGPGGSAQLDQTVAALMGGRRDPSVAAAAIGLAAALGRPARRGPAAAGAGYACR